MKRIAFVLLLVMPSLCWAQQERIEVSDDMKRVPQAALINIKNVVTKPYEKARRSVGTIPSNTTINTKWTVVVDGIPAEDFDLSTIKAEDIEFISVLKNKEYSHVFGNTEVIICVNLKESKKEKAVADSGKDEYEVIVFDPGFEGFLATQKSKDFYSEWSLKSKNTLLVNEWNSRHINPIKYDPNIYEVSIDYDPKIEYGLDVEYQLYMFFRFMEKENDISLSSNYYAANI